MALPFSLRDDSTIDSQPFLTMVTNDGCDSSDVIIKNLHRNDKLVQACNKAATRLCTMNKVLTRL